MLRTNFHRHTYRCKHAGGTEADYVRSALEKGISILGFSDHAPYKDDRYGYRMDFCELEEHIAILRALQKDYADQIIIKRGLEIEYDPREKAYYEELLSTYGFEYLVFGQHIYIDPQGKACNIYEITDTAQYVEYAHTLIEGMKSGYFNILAHPDVIFINNLPWDDNCEKASDMIIEVAKELDFILEFNANGVRRGETDFVDGRRFPYPHKHFWDKVAATDIRVIVNSDCHGPEQIWDEVMEEAHALAKNWNLNVIETIF